MYKAIIIAIGIAAAVCLVAGCGSSGEETASAALTKAQFIKQADQACAKVSKEREAAAEAWTQEHPGKPSGGELDEAFEEIIVPSVQEQIEALEALTPPAADRAEIARLVDNLTEVNRHFEKEGAEGTRQPVVREYQLETKELGLENCMRLY